MALRRPDQRDGRRLGGGDQGVRGSAPRCEGEVRGEELSRPDGETVFHGHGPFDGANGTITVPEGTSIAFYGEHATTISREMGMRISGRAAPRWNRLRCSAPATSSRTTRWHRSAGASPSEAERLSWRSGRC
ncbi:putative adhesin [Streptomyces sp. YKOK-I1]